MPRKPGGQISSFTLLSTPSAPAITGVTTSIGSASVAFTAPTDVGDAAVSSYVVTAVDESSGASTGATGSASPINLPLSSGTFKIRMQALNAYGPGRLTEYDTGNVVQYSGAELWAWGANSSGQVGDNTVVARSSPVQVGALTNWKQVSFSAAVKSNGTLWAWGYNSGFSAGRIGDGTVVNRSSPVQIGALTTWEYVSSNNSSTAAIKNDGTLWTWGRNDVGQLGIGLTGAANSRSSPVQVGALTDWATVSMGSSTAARVAAIKTNGTLWAWGQSTVGDGFAIQRSAPIQIGVLTDWAQVSAGGDSFAAVKTNGTLWTWGDNTLGQLGRNNIIATSSPVQVGALTSWRQSSVFGRKVFATRTNNTLWSWGENDNGSLGQNTGATVHRSSPVQIGALTNWLYVSGTAALKTDGTLWSWGTNFQGALGDNTDSNKSSPVQIGALTNWYDVFAGASNKTALYGVV